MAQNHDPDTGHGVRYFLADIITHFHCGEAVVIADDTDGTWRCLFTLYNRSIDVIHNVRIEAKAVIRIIREQDIACFYEYMVSNSAEQTRYTKNVTDT
ncbi:MAG: hypothetical protein JW863_03980 [Chitinispirillaceae bacterium]|nr:hypothetical protein [Chitinispirillaceae bacterium]